MPELAMTTADALDRPAMRSQGGLVKIWVAIATNTSESALFSQWIPVSP
jgi:hypothetical protein